MGSFSNSYELYTRAISSDPGVGAFSAVTVRKAGYTSYYNYIGLEILNRFDTFKQKLEEEIEKSVSKFHEGDFINISSMIHKITEEKGQDPLSKYLRRQFSCETLQQLENYDRSDPQSKHLVSALISELNKLILAGNIRDQLLENYAAIDEVNQIMIPDERYQLACKKSKKEAWKWRLVSREMKQNSGSIRLNRLFLEEAYPDAIKRSIDDSALINKDRKIKDDDNKEITERIIDIVYSFVLNDYGNACLNYYHRFGDPERLKNAIEAYEKSINLYPENKVVYYNLANAYGWEENESEQIDRLKKAVKIGPRWHVAATSLVYTLLVHYEKDKREIFSYDASEKKNVLKSDLKCAVDEVMRTTKLSSLYNMYSKIDDKVIDELTSNIMDEKIEEGNLDEQDVQALKIMARILLRCKNKEDKAVNFCRYILRKYYPDEFYISLSLNDLYKDPNDTTKKEFYTNIVTSNIKYWLKKDPVWYAALCWASEYIDPIDAKEFIELVNEAKNKVSKDAVAPYEALRDKAQLGNNNEN